MGRTAHRISIVCLGPPSPLVQQALCKLVDELGVPGETAGARSAKGPLPMTSAPFAVLGFSGGVCSPFDAESYFHCHADVRGGGVADAGAALMHFVRHGLAAGYSWHGPEAPAFEHLVIHCEVAEAELMAQWRRAGAHIIAVLDDPVRSGDATTLVCTVSNSGTLPSGPLEVVVLLPEGGRMVGDPIPTRVRIENSRVNFGAVASIPPGGRQAFEVSYRLPGSGTGRASAIVTGGELDGPLERICQTTFLEP